MFFFFFFFFFLDKAVYWLTLTYNTLQYIAYLQLQYTTIHSLLTENNLRYTKGMRKLKKKRIYYREQETWVPTFVVIISIISICVYFYIYLFL